MTAYEQLMGAVDTIVDGELGDTLTYTVGATGQSRSITGFISTAGDIGGIDGLNPLPRRIFVKITKALLPAEGPKRADVITSRRLPGRMRPADTAPALEGPYWIIELQQKNA